MDPRQGERDLRRKLLAVGETKLWLPTEQQGLVSTGADVATVKRRHGEIADMKFGQDRESSLPSAPTVAQPAVSDTVPSPIAGRARGFGRLVAVATARPVRAYVLDALDELGVAAMPRRGGPAERTRGMAAPAAAPEDAACLPAGGSTAPRSALTPRPRAPRSRHGTAARCGQGRRRSTSPKPRRYASRARSAAAAAP